jgi:hypothetical protein
MENSTLVPTKLKLTGQTSAKVLADILGVSRDIPILSTVIELISVLLNHAKTMEAHRQF